MEDSCSKSRGEIMEDWTRVVMLELGRCGCILDYIKGETYRISLSVGPVMSQQEISQG